MSGMRCDAPGCTNPIMQRCSQCQHSYCLRHMAQGSNRCDLCIAKNQKAGGSLMKSGCITTLSGMLLIMVGIAFARQIPVFISEIGAAAFIMGLVILIVGVARR